jgi:hypothetical protein
MTTIIHDHICPRILDLRLLCEMSFIVARKIILGLNNHTKFSNLLMLLNMEGLGLFGRQILIHFNWVVSKVFLPPFSRRGGETSGPYYMTTDVK